MGTKAVVVGMSERDAFALSLLIRRLHPDWACESATPDASNGTGDVYVLDADAWRDCHGPQQASLRLEAFLGAKPAVLVTAPVAPREEARAQAATDAAAWAQRGWVVLRRPYGASDMRDALEEAEHHAGQVPAPAVAPASVAAPVAARRADTRALPSDEMDTLPPLGQTAFFSTSVHGVGPGREFDASALPPPELGEQELTLDEFRACIGSSPLPECRQFLGALAERLAAPGAFEMSFTMINGLIFGARRQAVASNTPLSVLRMVARSRALGAHIRFTDIAEEFDLPQRAAQRDMQLIPLGVLLHALARMADCSLPGPTESH